MLSQESLSMKLRLTTQEATKVPKIYSHYMVIHQEAYPGNNLQ